MKRIILASKSPRRHELLEMVGIPHEVITCDCEENISCHSPADMVCRLSVIKAEAVARLLTVDPSSAPSLVIGADTVVSYNGEILGKPEDEADAFRMLSALSGHTHSVFTGVTVIDTASGRKETFFEETKVRFYEVTEAEIRDYIAGGEPMDKAGSYGIQGRGAFLAEGIEGDFYTVVGLPVARLIRVLKTYHAY